MSVASEASASSIAPRFGADSPLPSRSGPAEPAWSALLRDEGPARGGLAVLLDRLGLRAEPHALLPRGARPQSVACRRRARRATRGRSRRELLLPSHDLLGADIDDRLVEEFEFRIDDRFAQIKDTYEKYGDGRSNLRYGYVTKPLA